METVSKDRIVKSLDLLRYIINEKVKIDHNDFGLCPFHEEKTRSFHLFLASSGRARYHCFGCGAKGDIFNYLWLAEGLKFSAAIYRLSNLLDRDIDVSSSGSPPPSSGAPVDGNNPNPANSHLSSQDEDYIHHLLDENQFLREQLDLGEFSPFNEDPTLSRRIIKGICRTFLNPSKELLSLVNNDTAILVSIAAYLDLDKQEETKK